MNGILQEAGVAKRGLILDPRTKLILLFTMTFFVLGSTGGAELGFLMPAFCVIPAIALISGRKYKTAVEYIIVYSIAALDRKSVV